MRKIEFLSFLFLILFTVIVRAQEIHTQSNASSITNESNSTNGWNGNTFTTSESTDSYSGGYSIMFEAPSNGSYRGEYIFSTTPGEQYIITIYAKSSSTSGPSFHWDGFYNGSPINIGTDWMEYTTTLTASGTNGSILVYTGVPALAGDSVYIDHVSITPVNAGDTQAPTAPTLSSTVQTDTTADFSWSGATDNTAVTGYKIFKDNSLETTLGNVSTYQVTGLTASTTYNFTATALDAAGNESAASNAVSITTNSSGGGSSGGGSSVWTETNSVASYTGDVAIGTGTVPSGYKMAIDGKLITEEVKVQLSGNWPDYVFTKDYDLLSLEEVQKHIKEQGHLPNIPSAKEVEKNGLEVGEMNRLLLEKIEELTLYLILQDKKHLEKDNEISDLKDRIQEIKIKLKNENDN